MSTLAANNPTIVDVESLKGPDGQIQKDIVEILSQDNPFMMDGTFIEANGATFHRHTIRTGIPEPTWKRYYQGVQPTKSGYVTVDEPIGMAENFSQVDPDLLAHSGNPSLVRLHEATGILMGFNQSMESVSLYGSVSSNPTKFNGVLPRYSSLSAASGENIIDAGGTGSDNASILLMTWSPLHSFFLYPKGSKAGLERIDRGEQPVTESDGSKRYVVEEQFKQHIGFAVRDWRGNVRIANIDKSLLKGQSGAPAILELMAAAVDKLPTTAGARHAFYMPRLVSTMLRIQCMKQTNVYLTMGNEESKRKVMFDGIPIRRCDQMSADEARVT